MIRTVALHEFLSTVKRKSYYLVTLGMPVFVLLYAGFIGLISAITATGQLKALSKPVGVIDQSGILVGPGGLLHGLAPGGVSTFDDLTQQASQATKAALADLNLDGLDPALETLQSFDLFAVKRKLTRLENLDAARTALLEDTVGVAVLVPDDFLATGKLQSYFKERKLISADTNVSPVGKLLLRGILRQAQLPEQTVQRIQQRVRVTEYELDPDEQFVKVDLWSKGFSLGLPLGVSVLLVMALMMNASLLLTSVAEEKESRVIEVLLSSVPADQLLFGKVLGLVAAGLLQIVVWMAMVSVVPMLTMLVIRRVIEFQVPVGQLVLGGVLVVLGFVFYGCLLAGVGSLGSTYKDSQQLTAVVILCPIVPMMLVPGFLANPDGIIERVLSWIPLFSPSAMMLRLAVSKVPVWEVALSIAILLVSIWLAVKLSARLFRVGTLLYGKRPGIRQIWSALRQPA